ncbi:MAG: FG-GAP repeat domain-containing protein [Candidatus Bathycorpusculaceae bacterium]
MIKALSKKAAGLLIVAMLLMAFVPNLAYATNGLELEISYEWATDGQSYSNSVAAGDIDGDSITEMVTVGYFRNSSTHFYDGELDVWSWNGTDLTSELAEYFHSEYTGSNDTRFNAVALGNVDNETDTEIIVAGQGNFLFVISITPPRVTFQEQGLLFLGSWNGSTFTREDFVKWPEDHTQKARFLDLAIGDLDKDNVTEIVAVGTVDTTPGNETDFQGVMTIWSMTPGGLNLETSYVKSITGGETIWRAVTTNDVDNDGELEIVIVGDFYDTTLNHRCAMISICAWNGSGLAWETSSQWFTYSDTYATYVTVGDIDPDGIPEIVTSGYQRSGESVNAQIRVWTWYEEVLTLKFSVKAEW